MPPGWSLAIALVIASLGPHTAQGQADGFELILGGAGRALEFDGKDDFALFADAVPCPPFTIELWVLPSASSGGALLSRYSTWQERTLLVVEDNGGTIWTKSTHAAVTPPGSTLAGTWYHWALVVNGSRWSVYLNGTHAHDLDMNPADSALTCSTSSSAVTLPWVLGCSLDSYRLSFEPEVGTCFAGQIDELRVWERALAQEEIQQWMALPPGSGEHGLLRRWSFDGDESLGQGLSGGDGFFGYTPTLVISPFQLIGSAVVMKTVAGRSAEAKICAAVRPPTAGASGVAAVYVHGGNGSVGLLTEEGAEASSLMLDLVPQGQDGVAAALLCTSVPLKARVAGTWFLPYEVKVMLPSSAGSYSLAGNSSIEVVSQPDPTPVVGWARALELKAGLNHIDIGSVNIPESADNKSFSVSVRAWPSGVALSPTVIVQIPHHSLLYSNTGFQVSELYAKTVWAATDTHLPHLLTLNVHCVEVGGGLFPWRRLGPVFNTFDTGGRELFVDGQSLGYQTTRTCWTNYGEQFGLGDIGGDFGGIVDDLRIWDRALTAQEIKSLAAGHSVYPEGLLAHYTFDNDIPPSCHVLHSLGENVTCFQLNDAVRGSVQYSRPDREKMAKLEYVSSPFPLAGSPMHFFRAEGLCEELELTGSQPADSNIAFSLMNGTENFTRRGDRFFFCAPDLQGEGRRDFDVNFTGCDPQGRCSQGLAVIHVLRRGPSISRFQALPESNALRLHFSEDTNEPSVADLPSVARLLAFSGLPTGTATLAAGWENNRTLRVIFSAAGTAGLSPVWMQNLLSQNPEAHHLAVLDGIGVRIKREGDLKDAGLVSSPSEAVGLKPELLFCGEGRLLRPGALKCEGCPAGSVLQNNQGVCLPCEPGWYQPQTGQVLCDPCPVGRYSSEHGAETCETCWDVLAGSTTERQGTRGNSSCLCAEGTAWSRETPTSAPHCQTCTLGLLCPGGKVELNESGVVVSMHQVAQQERGFSAGRPEWDGGPPSFLVRCDNEVRCPGGLELGTCPPLAQGRACGVCTPGSFADGDSCRLCGDVDATWSMVYPVVILLLALVALYWFGTRPPALFNEQSATVTTSFSVIFAALQVLGALASLQVPWPEPIPTLKQWLTVVVLDIDHQGLQCFLPTDDVQLSYLASLATYPTAAIVMAVALLVKRCLLKQQLGWSQLVNMQGLGLMSLFTSIAALSVKPLKCRTDNPDGSSTVEAYRSVVCWESEQHTVMLGGSIAACLVFVVGFLAVLVWATALYPSVIASPGGGWHLVRFRFLFWPYSPKRYYFGLLFGLRKLMIALAPLVVVNSGQAQLLLIMLVIGGNMALQCSLWPWRTFSTNILDAAVAVMLMTLMATGFMLGDFEGADNDRVAELLVVVALAFGLGLFLFTVLWYAMKRYLNPQRTYKFFLSHHKVGAGLLSRWVKMILKECGEDPRRVFLDSDNLLHLDKLMHTVAYDTENVVILLTRETLSRPWCAMEIVAAYRAGTPVLPVFCDGYLPVDDTFLDALPSLWTAEQQATMASGGVEIPDVREAYSILRREENLSLSRKGADVQTHQQLVKAVLARCKSARKVSGRDGGTARSSMAAAASMVPVKSLWTLPKRTPSADKDQVKGRVAILSDFGMDEAACACRVLQQLLQESLQESVSVGSNLEYDPLYLMVLLGPGVLTNLSIAREMVRAAEQPSLQDLVPLLVGDFFDFPSTKFWLDLRDGQVFSHAELQRVGLDAARVEAAYRRLVNTLAIRFSGHGSSDIQSAEIRAMVNRVRICLAPSAAKKEDSRH